MTTIPTTAGSATRGLSNNHRRSVTRGMQLLNDSRSVTRGIILGNHSRAVTWSWSPRPGRLPVGPRRYDGRAPASEINGLTSSRRTMTSGK
jgi:hypothetical protein